MRSNAAAKSASSTHCRLGFAPRATWKMASIASWQPRPGRSGRPGLKGPGPPDRPGRGCHDAIDAIFHVARGANPKRQWVLDADLAAAFDRIDHPYLLAQLGAFPARG